MDVLSEVLRAVRLTGAIYFDVRAREPWIGETPPLEKICSRVMPEHEYVIAFHIMLQNGCWVQLGDESEAPSRAEEGDAILVSHGDGHVMNSEPGLRDEPDWELYLRPQDRLLPFQITEVGGAGDPARFVCGYIGCDARPFNPILNALPRLLVVKSPATGRNTTVELIRIALEESNSQREGSETILAKLSELMFVEALRQYMDEIPSGSRGWLSGLRDPHIGAALNLIHGRPSENWTLERLAAAVNMSRSAFADHFSDHVQEPPMRYLARWRMQLAMRLLEPPGMSIAQAAGQVGYQSEAAFNRAFKKFVGSPPGKWRRS